MCIFSGEVEHVGGTKIFARADHFQQFLVYSMEVAANQDVAMVLPLPVPDKSEANLIWIDLSGYPEFFDDMAKAFAPPPGLKSRGRGLAKSALEVVEVGDFLASYAPDIADLDRLDSKVNIPPWIYQELVVHYPSHGFAVFKLKDIAMKKRIHPMAMLFKTKFVGGAYFPTVHIHDGSTLMDMAEFDHHLYWQDVNHNVRAAGVEKSHSRAGAFVSANKSKRVINSQTALYHMRLKGMLRNQDHVFGVSRSD